MKKLVYLLILLVSIFVLYNLFTQETVYENPKTQLRVSYPLDDIIVRNKMNFEEMRMYALSLAHIHFQQLVGNVPIYLKDISEKKGENRLLWDKTDNKTFGITFFTKDGLICDYQLNIITSQFLSSSTNLPPTADAYFFTISNNERLRQFMREEEMMHNGNLFPLFSCQDEAEEVDFLDFTLKNKIDHFDLKRLLSYAHMHFGLLKMALHKRRMEQNDPRNSNIRFESDGYLENLMGLYNKDIANWPILFVDYHQKKHYTYLMYLRYRWILLIGFCSVVAVLSTIHIFRKSFIKTVRYELDKKSVGITTLLVYEIFWKNWKFIFYQPKDHIAQKVAKAFAEEISLRIRYNQAYREAVDLWKELRTGNLREEMLSTLGGNYKKAIDRKVNIVLVEDAINILRSHLTYLIPSQQEKLTERKCVVKKTEKNKQHQSERQRLMVQIAQLIDDDPKRFEPLSTPQLFLVLKAIDLLPKMHVSALEKFLFQPLDVLLKKKRFVEALEMGYEKVIKDELGLKEPKAWVPADVLVNEKALDGLSVGIVSGHRFESKLSQAKEWARALGATEVRTARSARKVEVDSLLSSSIDLLILVRPLDHSTTFKAKKEQYRVISFGADGELSFRVWVSRKMNPAGKSFSS